MHRRVFTEGRPCSSPQSRREWETQKLPPKKKGGSSVLYSGLHEKTKPQELSQTARGDGGTIRKVRKIFPLTRAGSPVMHQCIFAEGWPHLFPQSRREWETQKLPPKKKGGSSVLYSGFHGNSNPKGFPKLPGAMAGQFGKRGRFFSRRGPTLPLCTNAFLQRGDHIISPNPAGNGKHKSSHRRKKVGAVFYIPDFMEIQTPRAFPNRPG